jgi:hypothetical protein
MLTMSAASLGDRHAPLPDVERLPERSQKQTLSGLVHLPTGTRAEAAPTSVIGFQGWDDAEIAITLAVRIEDCMAELPELDSNGRVDRRTGGHHTRGWMRRSSLQVSFTGRCSTI